MTGSLEHQPPLGKQDCIDNWRKRGRITVPIKRGDIADLLIVTLYETTARNRLPLDVLIEAQTAINTPTKHFGVIFGDTAPDWAQYKPLHVLWMDGEGNGRWK
jgi:hypothetical protein